MKKCSTLILRLAVIAAALAVLAICGGLTWWVASGWATNPNHHTIMTVLLVGIYAALIPFLTALYQSIKLLGYIDTNRAFSDSSVKALRNIMYCAIAIFAVCTLCGLPFFYYWADLDDAPGFMLIGMVIDGIAFIIAVFASVLKRIFQDAIEFKSENDLTI